MRIGSLEVTPVSDGTFKATGEFFGPGVDMSGHAELLDADGFLVLPIGCFAVRTGDRVVLIDAGLGDVHNEVFDGGHLLDGLAAAGIGLDEIDTVVCSHLHLDHCGWVVDRQGTPVFPNATVRCGSSDWDLFVEKGEGVMFSSVREGLRALGDRGRVALLSGDEVIAPGISAMAAPGHTPGHVCVVLSSGEERALLLGDAITCPAQLEETDWAAMSDVDPALAAETRRRLWQELEGEGTVGAGAHFPGLQFGRVMTGTGKRWWT